MNAPTIHDSVVMLMNQYRGGVMYGENNCSIYTKEKSVNTGYFGSPNIVFLSSHGSMVHEAPACIAAKLVNMVAKNTIHLGMDGQGSQPCPVRIYAPDQFSITTKHLFVGDLKFLVNPENGFISCKNLTLQKFTEEEPEHFEIIKSWLINDDVEIETTEAIKINMSANNSI